MFEAPVFVSAEYEAEGFCLDKKIEWRTTC